MHYRLLVWLRVLLRMVFDGLVCSMAPRGATVPETLLVVRLDGIGDMVLWLPSAHALRRGHPRPRWHLTAMATPAAAALLRREGVFDAVIEVDPRRFEGDWGYRRALLRQARASGYAVAIAPANTRAIVMADALVRASAAPQRIAPLGEDGSGAPSLKPFADRWYTRLVDSGPASEMELARNARFLSAFGADPAVIRPRLTGLGRPDAAPRGGYAVFAPGAAWSGRRWPVERFAALAKLVQARTGWAIVVCGDASERGLAERLVAAAQPLAVTDLSGSLGIVEVAGLLAGASLVVCNETAALHISAAVGTPTVCVLGGGHHGRFLPYPAVPAGVAQPVAVIHAMPCFNCNWWCVHHPRIGDPMPCVAGVTLDRVWAEVEGILAADPAEE